MSKMGNYVVGLYEDAEPEQIECFECDGHGKIFNNADPTSGQFHECEACNGEGWRAETDEERNDRAADAFSDMCESEPPITMRERQLKDWEEHRKAHG